MEGRRDRNRTSTYEWRTERPTHPDVVAWIRFVFLLLDKNDFLRHPLSDWEATGHQSWVWHCNADRTKVYKVTPHGTCDIYDLVISGVNTRGRRFALEEEGLPTPSDMIRVSLRHKCEDWVEVAEGCPRWRAPPRTTFWHYAAKWGASAFFEHIDLPLDLPGFAKDLQDGHVIACGDGSFQPELLLRLSSSAWKMKS